MSKFIHTVSLLVIAFFIHGSGFLANADDSIWVDDGEIDYDAAVSIPESSAPVAEPASELAAEPAAESAKPKVLPPKGKAQAVKSVRQPASVAARGKMMMTRSDCPMFRGPASQEEMIVVKGERKIWTEEAEDGWVKAFNKAGEPGYLSRDCFQ